MFRIQKERLCFDVQYNGQFVVIKPAASYQTIGKVLPIIIQNLTFLANHFVRSDETPDKIMALKNYFEIRGWLVNPPRENCERIQLNQRDRNY